MSGKCCLKKSVGREASEYFRNGFHCAEAVVAAILESKGVASKEAVAHATPFGGGMGRTFCETCGALTGALIAIGHLHGRKSQNESWDTPAAMGKELRDSFIGVYGQTQCGALRDRFGEEQGVRCAQLVEKVAEATMEILA